MNDLNVPTAPDRCFETLHTEETKDTGMRHRTFIFFLLAVMLIMLGYKQAAYHKEMLERVDRLEHRLVDVPWVPTEEVAKEAEK